MQVLKMFGGASLGGALGGNPWDLGTSLGIDLVELAVRDEKTTKGEGALLTLWGSVLKGALTGDKKKLVCQILGDCVAEATNQLPETDENTSLERRIARALLTNSDVQAHFIKGFVDKRFKDDPKPKADWDWFAKNSPRIDHLRNMHPNHPKNFYNAVRREFAPQNLNELQIRRTLKYSGFNTYS